MPLVPLGEIAVFLGCAPGYVQRELARARVVPYVNTETTGPVIGYDPHAVQQWLADWLGDRQNSPRVDTRSRPRIEQESSRDAIPVDDETLLDFETGSLNP